MKKIVSNLQSVFYQKLLEIFQLFKIDSISLIKVCQHGFHGQNALFRTVSSSEKEAERASVVHPVLQMIALKRYLRPKHALSTFGTEKVIWQTFLFLHNVLAVEVCQVELHGLPL